MIKKINDNIKNSPFAFTVFFIYCICWVLGIFFFFYSSFPSNAAGGLALIGFIISTMLITLILLSGYYIAMNKFPSNKALYRRYTKYLFLPYLILIFFLAFIYSKSLFSKPHDIDYRNEMQNIWVYDSVNDKIIQTKKLGKDSLTYEVLIDIINYTYQDKVRLDFVNISNDTIFVEIENSEYLTQKMGTTGADEFMISATFTLTELPDISFVNFEFQDGDHATPGTYNRGLYYERVQGD